MAFLIITFVLSLVSIKAISAEVVGNDMASDGVWDTFCSVSRAALIMYAFLAAMAILSTISLGV